MILGIAVLNSSGHLSIEWDPNDPSSVAAARKEVDDLRTAGYSFFLTDGEPADEVTAGRGKLQARRVEDPVVELTKIHARESVQEPPGGTRRGSPRAERAQQETVPGTAAAIAVRPMRGG